MKHLIHLVSAGRSPGGFTNILFCARGQIIIVLILFNGFNAITTAQETPAEEFVLDGFMNYESLWIDPIYNSYIDCGFNTMTQRATDDSKSLLSNFNLHAVNAQDSLQWIYYYSSAYYSKWEAEEDQQNENKVGVKHSAGEAAYWYDNNDTVLCWSTKGLTGPANTLVYGPTYHQEKWYRRWYDGYEDEDRYNLKYTPRFRMALDIKGNVSPDDPVCRIYVILKYCFVGVNEPCTTYSTDTLKEPVTLKVSDFPSNGDFDYIYFSDFAEERSYDYPSWTRDPITDKLILPEIEGTYFDDKRGGQGVQFCIDWLRTDTLCTLYIDNIEVYDNNGWNDFIIDPNIPTQKIREYALNFSGWTNMKHWMGGHEPSSIDSYIPIRTVDALIRDVGAPPILNTVWAFWTLELNGESQLERYYNMVRPNKLLSEIHPISASYDVVRPFDLEVVRRVLQESYRVTQDSGFYFHVQSYGEWKNGDWYIWRFPTVPEHKAIVMLALSHGADGLVQAQYDSYPGMKGIIRDASENYDTTDIWFSLRDNIFPRIKGKLGNTLLSLKYTGNFLGLRRYLQDEPGNNFYNTGPSVNNLYLTLSEYTGETPPPSIHFHAGFFEKFFQPDNHHFFLTNLITTGNRYVNVKVINDCSVFQNTRFRNVEPETNFDTTFTCLFLTDMLFPPGEGRLYQVAPVVKYGGKLIYNETIYSETTLLDEMVIQNGATLTVNSTYNVDRDIRIKAGGSIVTTNGGTLKFYEGSKLIIEGIASLSGTTSHKLILDFLSPENDNGIIVDSLGSLTISFCEVKNAVKGITCNLDADYLNAHNVNFIDCSSYSIIIMGRRPGEEPTPPPQIKYCTITNSDYGIHVSNLPEIIIEGNAINNTDLGIYLSSVSSASVIDNQIHSNTENMSSIFCNSVNGSVRGNHISGHATGIYFANASAIDVGGNIITDCLLHGMFVGDGSVLNMVGNLVQAQGHHYYYATSGYNKIYENGGYEGFGLDNDGSEIFFNGRKSNAIMNRGCNSTFDDREPSPPLVNTELLMNSSPAITVSALHNYWGRREVNEHRFGNMTVDFGDALADSCHLPDGSGGGLEGLIVKSSFGDVIDTVYTNGEEGENLTETEIAYSEAEEKFLTGDMANALQLYDGIIASGATEEEKYFAYERKYEIGRMTGQSPEYFNELGAAFTTLASNAQDSLNQKILNQHSILCKVGEQEYEQSIGDFDAIIQQNPNTEEAVYAEIDAITTAILIEEADSTLHKGKLGKYLIKPGESYFTKLDGILRKHFGNGNKESETETLPTEYTLYQNYPNPFNPITTIKYNLPNAGNVSLVIYDILGRKVKELVNTKQQAGRYEIQFNASSLASGIYIYQLVTEKYNKAKKMILLKLFPSIKILEKAV